MTAIEFPLICEVARNLIAKGEPVHLVARDLELGELTGLAFSQNPEQYTWVMVHYAYNASDHIHHVTVDQLETNSVLKKVNGRWLLKTP